MSTIKQIFGLNSVSVNSTYYQKALPEGQAIDPSLVFGVELEIEGVPNWDSLEITGITSTADGSLRNNGREFLLLPAKYPDAVATLSTFFNRAKLTEANYSERCSIHVHSNCQDLTFDQLQVILFTYQIVERVLFNWVNPERASNIFCVPWYDTNLQHAMFDEKFKPEKMKNWLKYTALNLLPLYSYGTIEWRHMHGHCDTEKLFRWLRIISCFYRFARKSSLKDVKEFFQDLNTSSEYRRFVDSVFQEEVAFIYEQPTWERDLEEGVLLMKYSLASPKETKSTKTEKVLQGNVDPWPHARPLMDDIVDVIQEPPMVDELARARLEQERMRVMNEWLDRRAEQLRAAAPNPWPNPVPARPRRNNGGAR